MNDLPRPNELVTPEAVAIDLDLAGLGSRLIALLIDSLIQGAALLVFFLVFVRQGSVAGVAGSGGVVMFVAVLFLVLWAYFPLFEGLGGGQTPGKKAQRIRVMQADGQPAGFGAIVVRNLLRVADFLPAYYAAGAITILATRRSQRIGDLAAGTIVVRERQAPTPAPPPALPPDTRPVDTMGLTERDYDVARAFLQRRATLDPDARAELAHKIASTLRGRTPGLFPGGDEDFLEAIVASYRERFSSGGSPPPYAG